MTLLESLHHHVPIIFFVRGVSIDSSTKVVVFELKHHVWGLLVDLTKG